MAKNPKISVIVSTKNEGADLPHLLSSLQNQTYTQFETIIVDNFSHDNTLEIAKQFTSLVFSKGNERSQQRNFGVKIAKGDIVVILDADMELPKTILSDALKLFRNKNIVAAIIPETVSGNTFFAKVKRLEKKLYENEPLIEAPRIFKKNAFMKIHGYNKNLIAGEDWDIGHRIKKIGDIERIRTRLYHHEESFLREIKHKWYYAKEIWKYQKTHSTFFKKQSGFERLYLFWEKRKMLFSSPVVGISLLFIKFVEFLIYKVHK